VHALLAEVLSAHAAGIDFVEAGAGRALDEHMAPEGFRVRVWTDPTTGFVHGGNASNCGTWMDKMGSVEGVNKGIPATPRDGAAVEIVGLLYSTLAWVCRVKEGGLGGGACFPTQGPSCSSSSSSSSGGGGGGGGGPCPETWVSWRNAIALSFEPHFYVPLPQEQEGGGFHLSEHWVNKRGIYKDTVGSSAGWADYQLRPNFFVAMAVAPALFKPQHAEQALKAAEAEGGLVRDGSRGVATLDRADWAYRGDYDNAYAGEDRARRGGWNYHQGPEWLWPFGYYLRARLHFPPVRHRGRMLDWVYARLSRLRRALEESPEGGLPELTNASDAHCKDSCTVQAWSSACILDALQLAHSLG
jgi:glycogen debranching enzyme